MSYLRIRPFGQPILIFVLTGVFASIFSILSIDPHHDGILFKPALDVANGLTLFKDTFTQYGALTTWIQSWGLYFFGDFLIVIKLVTAFFYALSGVALWFLWRNIISEFLSTVSCLLWLILSPYLLSYSMPWSSVYALFFQTCSTLFIVNYVKSGKKSSLLMSGILASLVFWCRQPVGFFHFIALVLFISIWAIGERFSLKKWFADVAIMTTGSVLVSFSFLLWIYSNGALYDWWLQSIKFSFAFGGSFGGGFQLSKLVSVFFPYPLNSHNAGYIWNIFPIICLIVFIQKIFPRLFKVERFSTVDAQVLAIVIVALGSWHQYFPFPCLNHSFWAASPMVGILVFFIRSIFYSVENTCQRNLYTIGIVLIVFGVDFKNRVPAIVRFYRLPRIEISEPKVLRGMRVDIESARLYSDIDNHLESYFKLHPNKVLINATTDALFLTFSDRMRNFHPAYVKWGIIWSSVYPDYRSRLKEYVENERPLVFVYYPTDFVQTTENILKQNVATEDELFEKYKVIYRGKSGLTLIQPIDQE